ncbi:uncharacterized protein B0I36DRAFT_431119 [Microdochium trichocladiopsis]|uniref:Uncharacterized protein n=1 Tax=Microdochium trichocladiopsis TaxID=1682393 RepID=A0A9P9BTW8_9PEZI|nr:uncharacterized protein B0I36DRAFT_431119 [Microdochium trichocladiopsis]KAH7030874.1 hypothetical protein B0I36DRAFT_431119 [Microdochium trichocladiopsis]
MAITQQNRTARQEASSSLQGGSAGKEWNLEELRACGAVDTGASRKLDLTGQIHPVFANWRPDVEPRLKRELEQPLLLASKLLDGTGLPWISDFVIDNIFDESYPGRHALGGSGFASTGTVVKVDARKPLTVLRLSGIASALRLDDASDTTPPSSPSSSSWTASSSPPSSVDMSPRSSVASSLYSSTECPSPSPTPVRHLQRPPSHNPLHSSLPLTNGRMLPLAHKKSVSTSVTNEVPLPPSTPQAPETVIRHHRASWWTRGHETKWLHRTDRWLRRELAPALSWHLDIRGAGHDCNKGRIRTTRIQGSNDYDIAISSELPERLAMLRKAGAADSEEFLSTSFMTCITILHELGHAVYWRGCHPEPFVRHACSPEPFFGADLEMELGDSFVSSLFGGWTPTPIVLPEGGPKIGPGLFNRRGGLATANIVLSRRHTKMLRFKTGLAWRQALSWDRHRIRPKYRAHYSIPIDHMALLFSQPLWDSCEGEPATLIHPLALVQDETASLTSTVGLITNAAVLKGEHACAALPDFVAHPSGEGWMWKQTRNVEQLECRIKQYNGRLCLDSDLPVASEGDVQEALPVGQDSFQMLQGSVPKHGAVDISLKAAIRNRNQQHREMPNNVAVEEPRLATTSTSTVYPNRTTTEKLQLGKAKTDKGRTSQPLKTGSELLALKLSEARPLEDPDITSRNNRTRPKSLGSVQYRMTSREAQEAIPPVPKLPASAPNFFPPAARRQPPQPPQQESRPQQGSPRSMLPTPVRTTESAGHKRSVSASVSTATGVTSGTVTLKPSQTARAVGTVLPAAATANSRTLTFNLRRSLSARHPRRRHDDKDTTSNANISDNHLTRDPQYSDHSRVLSNNNQTIPVPVIGRFPAMSMTATKKHTFHQKASELHKTRNYVTAASSSLAPPPPRPPPPPPPSSAASASSATAMRRHNSCSRATNPLVVGSAGRTTITAAATNNTTDEKEVTVEELRLRLSNMIDTSITELEWLYF